jgi:hypothetical protein
MGESISRRYWLPPDAWRYHPASRDILLPMKTSGRRTEDTVADSQGGQPCTDGHGMRRPTPARSSRACRVSLSRQSVTHTRAAQPRPPSGVIKSWRMRHMPLRRISIPGPKPVSRRSTPGCRSAWEH